jgi:hypothetical protein
MNIDKVCINSTKYKINKYFDRIELYDIKTYEYVVTILKKQIIKNPCILKLI